MCGRYTLQSPADLLRDLFSIDELPELQPRYNIAPTQRVPAVRLEPEEGRREFALLQWGLIPFFAKHPKIGARMINARSETVAEKPSFRVAFKRRRCLIPADGYYEWIRDGQAKKPVHIHRPDRGVFAMAGLWESWKKGDKAIESFTIITTEAEGPPAEVHHRMPVILERDDFELWLDSGVESPDLLLPLLRPWDGEPLVLTPVSQHVNNARNDDSSCLEAL